MLSRSFSIVLVLAFVLPLLTSFMAAPGNEEAMPAVLDTRVSRAPIRIDLDNQFTTGNGVSNPLADGTKTNPYIIENWDIDATGKGCGIFIGNTTKWFIIRNCNVQSASGNSGTFFWNSGMVFYNVKWGTVEKCNSSSNGKRGIYAYNIQDCTLRNNTGMYNLEEGMRISSSQQNEVSDNNLHYNTGDGIFMDQSHKTNLSRNKCFNNGNGAEAGINNTMSNDNNYIGNVVSSNNKRGMYLWGSARVVVKYNTFSDNMAHGVYVHTTSTDNDFHHNNFVSNNGGGVQAYEVNAGTRWDDNVNRGNYWDDFKTRYPAAVNDTNIWNRSYDIPGGGGLTDRYPLCKPAVYFDIITADVKVAYVDQLYKVKYLTTAPSPSSVMWTFLSNASSTWLEFNTLDELTGTPSAADDGKSYFVNLSATYLGKTIYRDFDIRVMGSLSNQPPVINTASLPDATEDEPYWFVPNATDPDGDDISFSLLNYPAFLSVDPATGNLSCTAGNNDVGVFTVRLQASDGKGGFDVLNTTLTVLNVNDPPIIYNSTDQLYAQQNAPYSSQYNAIDIDLTFDTLTWHLDTEAGFLSIGASTGLLSGTPSNAGVGLHYVNVSVDDGNGGWDWTNFTLDVQDVNDPPYVANPLEEISLNEDTAISDLDLSYVFADDDIGDTLTFRDTGSVMLDIKIARSTGNVTITPPPDWSGAEMVNFSANDSKAEAHVNVLIIVKPVNDPPTNVTITSNGESFLVGSEVVLMGNATDVDIPYGDELTFTWWSNISGKLGTGQEMRHQMPEGYHEIFLNVSDKAGAWASLTYGLEVVTEYTFPDDDIIPNGTDDDIIPNGTDDDIQPNGTDDDVQPNGTDDDDEGIIYGLEAWEIIVYFFVPFLFLVIVLIVIVVAVMRRKRSGEEPARPPPDDDRGALEAEVESGEVFRQKEAIKTLGGKAEPMEPATIDQLPESEVGPEDIEITDADSLLADEEEIEELSEPKTGPEVLALPPAKFFDASFDKGPEIDEIFFISKTGILMRHFRYKETHVVDEDILASMLHVVQGFISDSFGQKKASLKKLEFGDFNILITPGEYMNTVVISPDENIKQMEKPIKLMLQEIERNNEGSLKDWNGDQESFLGIEDCVDKMVSGGYE